MKRMKDIGEASQALTSMSLREDIGVIRTSALRYPGGMFKTLKYARKLTAPFKEVVEEVRAGVYNNFRKTLAITHTILCVHRLQLGIKDDFVKVR